MRRSDHVLLDDEEVVCHLHPHWGTVVGPVAWLLLVVGAGSYGAAAVPAGPHQGALRLGVLGVAVVLLLWAVVRPVLRWATTHSVVTTHRLLLREGVLVRRGADIGYPRITGVGYRQTLGQRLVGSGTVTITVASAEGTATTTLEHVPRSGQVAELVDRLVAEDAALRAADRGDRPAGATDLVVPW